MKLNKAMLLMLSSLTLAPLSAYADPLEDALNASPNLGIRPSELREALGARAQRGFELMNYRLKGITGSVINDPMSNVDLRCAYQQFSELKKVNWRKYTSRAIEVDLVTKLSPFGSEIKPHFIHEVDTTNEREVAFDSIELAHRSFAGCQLSLAAEIEANLDNQVRIQKDAARERRAAERLAERAGEEISEAERLADQKRKVLELIGRSAPLMPMDPAECDDVRVLCANTAAKRAPAFERNAEAEAVLSISQEAR